MKNSPHLSILYPLLSYQLGHVFMKSHSPFQTVVLFVGLMLFWLSMSGYFDLLHIGFGVVSAGIVLFFFHSIRHYAFFEEEKSSLQGVRPFQFATYLFWLIWQIIKSGLYVAGVILKPSMPIEPSIVTFRADLPGPYAKMLLGNSITLTPGTLTVDIEGDLFTVHALTRETYAGIVDDSMPRQVLKLYSKEDRPVISEVKVVHTNL